MNLDAYYDQHLIEDNPNLDIVIKHGEFTWGKALTAEEREKLHAVRKRNFKDRGVGKRSQNNSESSPEDDHDQQIQEFSLNSINFSINKVSLLV